MAHSILGDDKDRDNLFDFNVGQFIHDYPGRVVDEVKSALNQIETERQVATMPGPGTLRLATAPFAPALQTLYSQAGNVLAPFVNRHNQSIVDAQRQFEGRFGLPTIEHTREHEPITGEQLAAPIAAAGSLLRGKFPTWFSPARRAVNAAPQQRGNLDYWLGRLKQQKGAVSEAKDLGLLSTQGEATESLLSAAPGTLTKEEALNFIEPIELEETVLGRSPRVPDELNRLPEVLFSREGFVPEGPDDTKYADDDTLNLPGGENPQEILIQLPTNDRVDEAQMIVDAMGESHEAGVQMEDLFGISYAEALKVLSESEIPSYTNQYTGGHWDEPNVLVSLRLNERIVDGKKTLHIEEIQSDWHQQGQKKGYGDTPTESVIKDYYEFTDIEWDSLTSDAQELLSDEMVAESQWKTVPDAPYKKTWHELGWKRAFLEALRDPSIEQLTWTTGDVQADRYDLAKHIDKIRVQTLRVANIENLGNGKFLVTNASGIRSLFNTLEEAQEDVRQSRKNMGNKVSLRIWGKGDDEASDKTVRLNDLPRHVGKELADKIYSDLDWSSGGISEQSYEGLDLQIGGEFHKQLYDQKITPFAKRFLKLFGIEPKRISSATEFDEVYGADGERYFIQRDLVDGQFDIIQGRRDDENSHQWMRAFSNYEDAIEGLGDFGDVKDDLWKINITPEMRETYAEGVPLAVREDERGLLGRYA